MRRMLDPTKVGGVPSTIEFDKDGNRKVKKNLGVDGKLTLKSLVSNTNPDGDITKELGGGKIYCHNIEFRRGNVGYISFNYYSTRSTPYDYSSLKASWQRQVACTGVINPTDNLMAIYIDVQGEFKVGCISKQLYIKDISIDNVDYHIYDSVHPIN